MNAVNDDRATINGADIFAEGEISLSEAETVIENLTEGDVAVLYDGPGAFEIARFVSPNDASEILDTAVNFSSNFDYDERLDREEQLEHLNFGNSIYGRGTVAQEMLDGYGQEGEETPLQFFAGTADTGTKYAVVADELEPAIRSTEADLESHLVMEGKMAGNPQGIEDIQEYARTVGGQLSEAYQTVANL